MGWPGSDDPLSGNRFQYLWHWWRHFGTGEAGNRACTSWTSPSGARTENPSHAHQRIRENFFDDDQQFPDTQYVTFEYPGDGASAPRSCFTYEQRTWTSYPQDDYPTGVTFYGDAGYLTIDMHLDWKLYGPKNKLLKQGKGYYDTRAHCADFFDAIRNDRRPNADIEIGHLSATLAHLSNILSYTGRRSLTFDPKTERFVGAPDANALVGRTYREGHWASLENL